MQSELRFEARAAYRPDADVSTTLAKPGLGGGASALDMSASEECVQDSRRGELGMHGGELGTSRGALDSRFETSVAAEE